MAKLKFYYRIDDNGVLLGLSQKKFMSSKEIAFSDWSNSLPVERKMALAVIDRLLADESDRAQPLAKIQEQKVWLSHKAVADFSETEARALDLPGVTHLAVDIKSEGRIDESRFSLSARWVGLGGRVAHVSRKGAFLEEQGKKQRIPASLYNIIEEIEHFRTLDKSDDARRYAAIARLKQLLPEGAVSKDEQSGDEQGRVSQDGYFGNIRIQHAASFSLNLPIEKGSFNVEPVLFARQRIDDQPNEGTDDQSDEERQLLTPAAQKIFAERSFVQSPDVQDCYAIERGHFVFIDPALKPALQVVRKVRQASEKERREFATQPRKALKEILGDKLDEATVEALFVETEHYSKRVLEIAPWQTVVLPWIKRQPNTWVPEKFGIKLGQDFITFEQPAEVEQVREQVCAALDASAKEEQQGEGAAEPRHVDYKGHTIPATPESLEALEQLSHAIAPQQEEEEEEEQAETEEQAVDEKLFIVVEENFEETHYQRHFEPRSRSLPLDHTPTVIRPSLKDHQIDGLNWLAGLWNKGTPGGLLADDMGLGKTLQALSFIAMLQENALASCENSKGRPVLIVAPTGLLGNWQEEIEKHTHQPHLGQLTRAYGRELRHYFKYEERGRDTQFGEARLDVEQLSRSDVLLTTFETLRDYHMSFGRIPFSLVIYDEMQKLKNPASQLSRVAKVLNAEFTIGMTGTPVENTIHDLWALMDVIADGYLGSSKEFVKTYPEDDHAALQSLRTLLISPEPPKPALMIRRMKSDQLKGLPEKHEHVIERDMPAEQADCYMKIVHGKREGKKGEMLKVLQHLRGTSLHPIDPRQLADYAPQDYINLSARLQITFELLDEIAAKSEKALVFLESRDMQDALGFMLKERYNLPQRPLLINGAVSGHKRQEAVNQFQSQTGVFDVMILSPKAGGVGLTLTAANHVIHLSRWWNPAVEDQCTDRIYRIGQDKPVHVYYPLAVLPSPDLRANSFDLKLNGLLTRKRELSRNMLMAPESSKDTTALFRDTVEATRQGAGESAGQSSAITLADIDQMGPIQFERWVLEQARQAGYLAQNTPVTGDGGADGILTHKKTGRKIILQCKHRQSSRNCDERAARDLLRARQNYPGFESADLLAVTNAQGYTAGAEKLISLNNIIAIDRRRLLDLQHDIPG